MADLSEALGERIRNIRKKMKLSRAEFANIVEMSEDALGLIERGETTPRLESLYKISANLNLPLASLLDFKEDVIPENIKPVKKSLSELTSYLRTKKPEQIEMIHDIARNIFTKKRSGYPIGSQKKRRSKSFIMRDKR